MDAVLQKEEEYNNNFKIFRNRNTKHKLNIWEEILDQKIKLPEDLE